MIPKQIPRTADRDYGHVKLDTSGEADAEDYDARISALMEGRSPPSLGPSSSGATSSGLSGGYAFPSTAASPTAKAMPKSSTSTTRPCPTSQGGQANKIRKIQDVMKNSVPLTPTPSSSRYRQMPPISQQACRKACEAIDHGMGQGAQSRIPDSSKPMGSQYSSMCKSSKSSFDVHSSLQHHGEPTLPTLCQEGYHASSR